MKSHKCQLQILRGSFAKVLSGVLFTALLIATAFHVTLAQVAPSLNVTARSYDNTRSGANLAETILTPANVGGGEFGKLFTVNVDGEVYAQPLYVSHLIVNGSTRNVVYVATMNNSVYALDADTGAQLWEIHHGTPIATTQVQYHENPNINPASGIGILSTPVIDLATNTMYYVHAAEKQSNGKNIYWFDLEAISILTGEQVLPDAILKATYQTADLSSPLVFEGQVENQRPGLALANGNVYIAFSSHNDQNNGYHGWVLAYSESTLRQVAAYSDTTIGTKGGIWQAGSAPAVDSAGNIYLSTGNGSFGVTPNQLVQTGESFIKLSPTLQLLDYFTPYNAATLNLNDDDLGSGGILLVPNPNELSQTEYVVGGGKAGVLYLTDPNDMGEFNSSEDQVVQEFQAVLGVGSSHIHGTPIYFNGSVYLWGENDYLRGFSFGSNGLMQTTPFAMSTMRAPVTNADGAMPGGFLSISANGTANAVLWASTPYNANASQATVQGVLYAFDPATLQVLWTDKTNDSRDEVGMFAKYVPPVVVNGKVYVPTFGPKGTTGAAGQLVVYGLLK